MKGIDPNKLHPRDMDTGEPSGILAAIGAFIMIGILVVCVGYLIWEIITSL